MVQNFLNSEAHMCCIDASGIHLHYKVKYNVKDYTEVIHVHIQLLYTEEVQKGGSLCIYQVCGKNGTN